MADQFITLFPSFIQVTMISLLTSWVCLKVICFSSPDTLKFLYISSGKSTTNARLLGGLSISAALLFSMGTIVFSNTQHLSPFELTGAWSALASILLVTFYGYIDDKFEVRVRFKLSLQLISIFSFAYVMAPKLSPHHPGLAFMICSFVGLALVNGTNLLDGLDTLSIKLGTAGLIGFLYLGILSNSLATVYLSVISIASFSMFYFFNREPAKVYMGEIGGSIIGLVFFIQASFCFIGLKTTAQMNPVKAISLVLIAACFPICELGISFFRRMWCKKTPFRGDKLHLHYILKNKYKLSASSTSTRMGTGSILLMLFGFSLSIFTHPVIGLLCVVVTTLAIYVSVCFQDWKSVQAQEAIENLHKIFEGKNVTLLNSTQFNAIDFSVENGLKDRKIKKSA